MSSVKKEAQKDAQEYARALMFYGKGAGTRRKLIEARVGQKAEYNALYADLFNEALLNEDFAEHSKQAQKERKRIDRTAKVERNVRGLVKGNKTSLTTGVMVLSTVAYYAHETGLDKALLVEAEVLKRKAGRQYRKGKAWVNTKRKTAKAKKATVYNITSDRRE